MTALTTTVLPRENDWSYPEMEEDYREARRLSGRTGADWREVTEAFWWQALEVLPPIHREGGFLVGEPYDIRHPWSLGG